MKQQTLHLLLLLAVQACSALSFPSFLSSGKATLENRRLVKHSKRGPQKRSCKLKQSKDEVKFACTSDGSVVVGDALEAGSSSSIKDKIDFKVRSDVRKTGGIAIRVAYHQDFLVEDDEDSEETVKTAYEIIYTEVIEYRKANDDKNEDLAYDWEKDSVVQSIPLSSVELSKVKPMGNGGGGDSEASQFSLTSAGGVVALTCTIHQAAEGAAVTANQMKIDVTLDNFPWMRNDTYLALMSRVDSEKKISMEYDTTGKKKKKKQLMDVVVDFDDAVEATSGFIPFGSYTWEETAEALNLKNATTTMGLQNATLLANVTADSVMILEEPPPSTKIDVIATSPSATSSRYLKKGDEDEPGQLIAFSFVGDGARSASSIFWDPEAGIGYAEASSGSLRRMGPLFTVGLLTGMTALTLLWA